MVSLPTLPTPACTTYFDVECVEVATRFYTAEQMQAYGQQCREQALLDAMNATLPFGKTGAVMSAVIGALK